MRHALIETAQVGSSFTKISVNAIAVLEIHAAPSARMEAPSFQSPALACVLRTTMEIIVICFVLTGA